MKQLNLYGYFRSDKQRLFISRIVLSCFLFCSSFIAYASDAEDWLQRMQVAVKQLNYDISFVDVQAQKVTPWRWVHGVRLTNESQQMNEYEIISSLNGPVQQVIRINDVLTYLNKEKNPFSVKTYVADGPLPEILRADLQHILQHYKFSMVGKSRVAGQKAQLIRIDAKDKLRYSLWLWLHEQTALPLKSAIVNRKGELLQQTQMVNFSITAKPDPIIEELAQLKLPDVTPSEAVDLNESFSWQINWVPNGFSPTKLDKRQFADVAGVVDYVMLSDGLVWFSVYIRNVNEQQKNTVLKTYLNSGAQTYLTELVDDYEVTIIGAVPFETAKKLAMSVKKKYGF